jgi:hypothetical protein
MKQLMKVALALVVLAGFALCLQIVTVSQTLSKSATQDQGAPVKAMREYKGVKLGLKRDQVHTALGKPTNSSDNSEDYNLTGEDQMTVHYDNGEVKAIQLVFLEPKNAPAWNDVVGDAEVNQTDTGAKHARRVVAKDNFWVSIWQSKDSSITRITISK